jgi:hypothetical protein
MRAPDCLDSPVYEPDEEHATALVLNAKERMDPAWRMQIAYAVAVKSVRCWCREYAMASAIDALGEQAQPRAIPKQDIKKRGILAAEDEQMARKGFLLQVFLDQRGKSVETLAHVGMAEPQVLCWSRRPTAFIVTSRIGCSSTS